VGWEGDERLSEDEKALLAAWAAAGDPEGDPTTAVPLPSPDIPTIDADLEVAPATHYTTSGDVDQIVCRTLDPGLEQKVWVTGVEVQADNLSVVHHVVVYVDPHAESAARADEDGTYDCFSTADVSDAMAIAVWVPGAFPTIPPEGSGFPVTAGSRLVLQMHYHPAGWTGADDAAPVTTPSPTRA
jgi:hypothetical protein